MLTHVYVLSHLRPYGDSWTGEFVGVYSSLDEVEKAMARLRLRMAFKDYPDGFRYQCLRLNQDYDDPTLATDAR